MTPRPRRDDAAARAERAKRLREQVDALSKTADEDEPTDPQTADTPSAPADAPADAPANPREFIERHTPRPRRKPSDG